MKYIKLFVFTVVSASLLGMFTVAGAQESLQALEDLAPDEFYKGTVEAIIEEGTTDLDGSIQPYQVVQVRLTNGPEAGSSQEIEWGQQVALTQEQLLKKGDRVVIVKLYTLDGASYFITDHLRLFPLAAIFTFFAILVIILGRWKGLFSLLGMGVSILTLTYFVVPQILQGRPPMLISIIGGCIIALLSIYLSHGFSRQTSVALSGTLITLGLSAFMAYLFVRFAHLYGLGSEDAALLQIGVTQSINLRGLLLGGIIIGTLGVLDDITTAQAAVVAELKRANPAYTFKHLYEGAFNVGREHIASLVNTLVLAYAGVSLPLLLLFTQNKVTPLWFTINNELIAEEIVRTLAGSTALVLAVPITTALAAYIFAKKGPGKINPGEVNLHAH